MSLRNKYLALACVAGILAGTALPNEIALAQQAAANSTAAEDTVAKAAFSDASAAFVRGDFVVATQKLAVACEAGMQDACFYLGDQYLKGSGVPQDTPRAALIYEKSCHSGQADSCNALGKIYNLQQGTMSNEAWRVSVFEKACGGGMAIACFDFAHWLDFGPDSVQVRPKVAEIYRDLCDKGMGKACYELAGKALQGWGVPQDFGRAADLLKRAIMLDPSDTSSRNILRKMEKPGEGY